MDLEKDRRPRAGSSNAGRMGLSRFKPGARAQNVLGIIASVLLLAFTVLWARCGVRGCPDVDELKGYLPEEASVVLDRDGEEVGKLFQVNRVIVPLDSLPEHVVEAFVAAEDRRFWDHGGIDWRRVPGAALANVRAGGVAEGFSTITMQLARNLFPDKLPAAQQTIWRKLGEMRVALDIEEEYPKRDILQMYLNQVYFGNGAWGIEAAAQEYFGGPASELTLAQAALLAGILPAPSRLNPRSNRDQAVERQDVVLRRMAEQGVITDTEAEEARAASLDLTRSRAEVDDVAPYFVEAVRQELEEVFGNELYTGGFRIHTTLDLTVQNAAQRALVNQIQAIESGRFGAFRHAVYSAAGDAEAASGYLQGAVVTMQANTGAVLALVGGRDFDQSKYNRALQARRQPGSAFKPFVYATALARGYPPTMRLEDQPIRRVLSGGQVWEPRNYGDSYAGEVTMREALVQSKNVATVRLSEQVGLQSILRTARAMGIQGDLPQYPSVVLGSGEVRVIDMATAYAAFATLGERPQPFFVTRIEGRDGRILWSREPRRYQVIDPAVAFLVTDMLRDVVDRGTGTGVRAAGFSGPAAGKTGTTNDATDVWFVGYTPDVVSAVWIGFDEPKTIVRGATGGSMAAPVWGRVMRQVPGQGGVWTPPPGVEKRTVDQYGNVVASNCPTFGETREEWFLTGSAPLSDCQYPGGLAWDSMGGWDSMPPPGEGDDGWFDRLRQRIFGEEDARDREPGRIRPGRPEDTIPLYRQPRQPRPQGQERRDDPLDAVQDPADRQPEPDTPEQPEPDVPDRPAPEPRPTPPADDDGPIGEPTAD